MVFLTLERPEIYLNPNENFLQQNFYIADLFNLVLCSLYLTYFLKNCGLHRHLIIDVKLTAQLFFLVLEHRKLAC